MRLGLSFYEKEATDLAQDLLGKILVRVTNGKKITCKIVEVEAYMGPEDKAAHSYNNRRTRRTEVMFWRAGHAYVYIIYGIHHCLNVVAAKENIPQGVLIRGIEPMEGIDLIRKNRPIASKKIQDLTNGPGKLCQALNIDKGFNGADLVFGENLYIQDNKEDFEVVASKRININYAQEYKEELWRFYIKDNKFVSVIDKK